MCVLRRCVEFVGRRWVPAHQSCALSPPDPLPQQPQHGVNVDVLLESLSSEAATGAPIAQIIVQQLETWFGANSSARPEEYVRLSVTFQVKGGDQLICGFLHRAYDMKRVRHAVLEVMVALRDDGIALPSWFSGDDPASDVVVRLCVIVGSALAAADKVLATKHILKQVPAEIKAAAKAVSVRGEHGAGGGDPAPFPTPICSFPAAQPLQSAQMAARP